LQFGKQDTHKGFSDEEKATQVYREMLAAKLNVELVVYDNAGHAFMNRDRPDAFKQDGN